jgi:hypothetical protein
VLTVGTLGVGIMNSTAFLLLANSNLEVDESQEMELTIGSLSFYVGPSGSTHLSDPTKSGPLASKAERITISRSSVGSSSEVNSPVNLTATEDMQEKLEEFNKTQGKPEVEATGLKLTIVQGTSPSKAVASLEVYISYASLSLKQQKRIITKATKRLTCKLTIQGVTAKRKKKKFMFQPESGESSCQPSITAQRYPQIQGKKF